ncbi:MAG: IncP-type conjugal transfer protein TraG [Rhodospirillaceae bacterium]
MKLSKFLIGQLSITALVTAGGLVLATQVAAVALKPRPLGEVWFTVGKSAIYAPARLPSWWSQWGPTYSVPFQRAASVMAFSFALGFLLSMAWRKRVTFRSTTYGSAHWATSDEVAAAGLTAENGVILGERDGEYLRHNGPEHVIVVAPTRSGKGVGLVIPTLLSWRQSVIVHDIKGENWTLTAGWRSRISHCLLFNPTEPLCARFNPLLEVRKGPNEIRDAQNIADILIDPEGATENESHWRKTSHSLLVAMILHVLYAEKEKTLARVASLMSEPGHSFIKTLHRMMETNHLGTSEEPKVHPVVAETAQEVLNKCDNERSSVLSTAISFLGLYRDPLVAQATAASDWRIADLMYSQRPVSLYLVIPPSDISRTRRLVRLILSQIGRRLTEAVEEAGSETERHDLLLLLDEFPQLGKLDFFQNTMAYMAHYGLKAFLIAQSLNQIDSAYGKDNSILDNCHVRVVFSTNDERTAKRISEALGTATETRVQRNYSGARFSSFLSHELVSRQEVARPLMTPGEVMQMPADDELILVSGVPPIRARKLRYFRDANFDDRLLLPPVLEAGLFSDRPTARTNEWYDQEAGVDERLRSAALPVFEKLKSEETKPEESAPEEAQPERKPRQRARKVPVPERDLFAAYAANPAPSLLPDRGVAR